MFSFVYNTFFYNPIYNGLIFLISSFSWIDLGTAVILITIIVKLILFPLTRVSIKTQIKIKEIEPQIDEIKKKYKEEKDVQAKKIMNLYKDNRINPFASFFLVLIQLPILFSLYFVFLKGGLPSINTDILYSFVKEPTLINTNLFHILDITKKSLFLALLAGISQYFQIKLVMPKLKEKKKEDKTMKDDLIKNMQLQMKFVMPIMIFFISYHLSAAVALYWTTSNIFMILQESYIRKNIKREVKN